LEIFGWNDDRRAKRDQSGSSAYALADGIKTLSRRGRYNVQRFILSFQETAKGVGFRLSCKKNDGLEGDI
jgi:hypothetical protein